MKKLFMAMGVVALMLSASSCTSLHKTSTALDVNTAVCAAATADLEVSPKKITYAYKPDSKVRRAGDRGILETAVAEALKANGNADVLVAPQYEITKRQGGIKNVVVSGYPATYKNFKAKPAK